MGGPNKEHTSRCWVPEYQANTPSPSHPAASLSPPPPTALGPPALHLRTLPHRSPRAPPPPGSEGAAPTGLPDGDPVPPPPPATFAGSPLVAALGLAGRRDPLP